MEDEASAMIVLHSRNQPHVQGHLDYDVSAPLYWPYGICPAIEL